MVVPNNKTIVMQFRNVLPPQTLLFWESSKCVWVSERKVPCEHFFSHLWNLFVFSPPFQRRRHVPFEPPDSGTTTLMTLHLSLNLFDIPTLFSTSCLIYVYLAHITFSITLSLLIYTIFSDFTIWAHTIVLEKTFLLMCNFGRDF